MTNKDKIALEKSIASWTKKMNHPAPEFLHVGWKECALCLIHFTSNCADCPVAMSTMDADGDMQICCDGTPYQEAYDALFRVKDEPTNKEYLAAWRAAAKKEVDFLISLREEEPNNAD
jgi:hypothetical protein